MKLPNAEQAVVPERKVTHYLLNPAHPDNGGKAEFFRRLGFQSAPELTTALRTLAKTAEVSSHVESPHGSKFVIVDRIESPEGKAALVRTIWIVDKGSDAARLVTAYPHQD